MTGLLLISSVLREVSASSGRRDVISLSPTSRTTRSVRPDSGERSCISCPLISRYRRDVIPFRAETSFISLLFRINVSRLVNLCNPFRDWIYLPPSSSRSILACFEKSGSPLASSPNISISASFRCMSVMLSMLSELPDRFSDPPTEERYCRPTAVPGLFLDTERLLTAPLTSFMANFHRPPTSPFSISFPSFSVLARSL